MNISLKSFVSTIEADMIRYTYVFMLIMSISGKNIIEITRSKVKEFYLNHKNNCDIWSDCCTNKSRNECNDDHYSIDINASAISHLLSSPFISSCLISFHLISSYFISFPLALGRGLDITTSCWIYF